MKKPFITIAIFILIAASAVGVQADLDSFLSDLNVKAKADINGFGVKLSAQFGIPLPQVHEIMKMVEFPADAFMCFELSRMINIQPERVLQVYKRNKGKGWGVIAKELGIKPGSAEFHALKRGDFKFTGKQGSSAGKGKDKGNGKGKYKSKGGGKGKGKGHNK